MKGENVKNSYLLLILVAACLVTTPFGTATAAVNFSDSAGIQTGMKGIQVPFIENRGQVQEDVAYYAQTFGGLFYLTGDGTMVLVLPGKENPAQGVMLKERLEGSSKIRPEGLKRAETILNVYSGSEPGKWRRGLPTFHSLTLNAVYDGIELELKAYGKNIEKIFRVHPKADPSTIRVQIEGAAEITTGEKGDLVVQTPFGPVTYSPPLAYQELKGEKRPVQVAYVVQGTSYRFKVGEYDRNLDLVIDPLLQSTYVGGMGGDSVQAVQIHPTSGKVYICGTTNSTGFGPAETSQTDSDAYVARLDAALTSFEQITRLEGSGNDSCRDLRLDATAGRVFLMGTTNSIDFPVQSAAQGTLGGGSDTFAAYLGTDLSLGSATYLGGSGLDSPIDMALNESTGDLYIVGDTDSADFPTTAGAPQPTLGAFIAGIEDGFITRYDSDLTVQMATYLGGTVIERMGAISVHPISGDVYAAGETNSDDLPGSAGGAQSTNAGIYDAFVARYNSALTMLVQTTYLGSFSGSEWDVGMEIHPFTGKIFLAGLTNPTFGDFPVVNAVQPTFGGLETDLFAAVFNTALTTVEAATYLGGDDIEEDFHLDLTSGDVYIAARTSSSGFASTDFATGGLFVASLSSSLTTLNRKVYVGGYFGSGLQVHPANGDLYLAGSTGNGLPGTSGGAQPAFGGGTYDAFVMRLSPDLNAIVQATYLGGSDNDTSSGGSAPYLAIHPLTDSIYVVGQTTGNFPGTSDGAQETFGGSSDGFVAFFDPTLAAASGTCTDSDGDGYGAQGTDLTSCSGSTTLEDCDDADPDNYPDNSEICDGQDNDCDTAVDEGLTFDGDSDGYTSISSCEGSADDCDDGDAAVNPGATETCNGIDDDCVNGIDDGLATSTYYFDFDGDAYGDPDMSVVACSPPMYYVSDSTDCDDSNAAVNPVAEEACNGFDDDCDASVDEGLPLNTYYIDADGDDYGSPSDSFLVCDDTAPYGSTTDNTDCDDTTDTVNPAAVENCFGLVDDDCDEFVDCDDSDCTENPVCTIISPCWEIFEVDDGAYSVDIAVDSSDHVHMCYFAPNPGGSGGVLRYATGDPEVSVDLWTREQIGFVNTDSGANCSIAVGSDDSVHIAFILNNLTRLLYATRGMSGWNVSIVEESGVDGECAIELDSDNEPHITYRRQSSGQISLIKAAHNNDPDLFALSHVFDTNEGLDTGYWSDLARDTQDNFFITFLYDVLPSTNDANFEMLYISDMGSLASWNSARVDYHGMDLYAYEYEDENFGHSNRLVIDEKGNFHITTLWPRYEDSNFHERTVNRILYGKRSVNEEQENYHLYWDFQALDTFALGQNLSKNDMCQDLAVDSQSNAHVVFYDVTDTIIDSTSSVLKYIKVHADETFPAWGDSRESWLRNLQSTEKVDFTGTNGRDTAIAVSSSGKPYIVYLAGADEIRFARKASCAGGVMSVSPSRWLFDLADVKEGYAARHEMEKKEIFQLRNIGDENLDITSIYLEGSDFNFIHCDNGFGILSSEVSPSTPITMASDTFRLVCVNYKPETYDPMVGQLVVETSAGTALAQLFGNGAITDPGSSGGCACSLSNPQKGSGVGAGVSLVFFILGLLLWRRRRLG